jgi:hypothetical protein
MSTRQIIASLIILTISLNVSNKLTFLGHEQRPTHLNMSPQDVLDFTRNFKDGLKLFSNLPDSPACNANDEAIVAATQDIIDLFAQIHTLPWSVIAQRLSVRSLDLITSIWEVRLPCLDLITKDYPEELNAMKGYFTNPDFLKKFGIHTGTEINTIKDKGATVYESFKALDYKKAGFTLGDFINFTVFFDYKK